MAKYKEGDILDVRGADSKLSLYTEFCITSITVNTYIGYYLIKGFDKQFSILLDIEEVDTNPTYKKSLKKILKKL